MSENIPALADNGLLTFIERAARDPAIDVSKLEALLRMHREVAAEQAERAFNAAMSACQGEMEPVRRDAVNSHVGNRYARLETIDSAMRPIYTKHGFSVRYGSVETSSAGSLRIRCTVSHAAGYSEHSSLEAQLDTGGAQGRSNKPPIQAVGSSVTYLRRYLLGMAFNVVLAGEDDDGEAMRVGPVRGGAGPVRGGARRPPPPDPLGDFDVSGQPDYPMTTKSGPRLYHAGSEWLEAWRRAAEACQRTDALDRLRDARDANEMHFAAIEAFDPQAVAEVREMLEALIPPLVPPLPNGPLPEVDPDLALP